LTIGFSELTPEVKWTMVAEARDYRGTLAMERHLQEDPESRRQWAESEAAYESRHFFDDEGDESRQEGETVALSEEPS
jgi:hypothetical protein